MSGNSQESTHRTIERVARESYGRLVAYLSSHTRDVAGAEDALSNALVKALTTWPQDGVPQNPEAWLLTTARHSLIDLMRHQQVAVASEPTLLLLREQSKEPNMTLSTEFPDERLKLLPRPRRAATAGFSSKSHRNVNCRSGSTRSWKQFMPPSGSDGMIWQALTSAAGIWQKKRSGLREFFCN